MEHEVFVPLPAESVRQVLTDPSRVVRCVPGLQQAADAAAGAPAGRLRVRAGGHTITYRGTLRIAAQGEVFAIEGEGTEARGTGSATLALTLRLAETSSGTTLAFTGTARGEGRLSELAPETALAAAHRLLDRFGVRLEAEAEAEAEAGAGTGSDAAPDESAATAPDEAAADGPAEGATPSVFDTEVPPPSLDPSADGKFDAEESADEESAGAAAGAGAADAEGLGSAGDPPVEAAHARRTMIGRSAEEVDHAPPRGRYAPVPAPSAIAAGATLRWAAPAAALALASAVVVGRALRRRR